MWQATALKLPASSGNLSIEMKPVERDLRKTKIPSGYNSYSQREEHFRSTYALPSLQMMS